MFKIQRSIITLIAILFTPMLAFADDADNSASEHRVANLFWGIAPFIVLVVLFWFFYIRRQQSSPLVKRHHAYLDSHEQHMKHMEQLLERIAVALEKKGNDS